MLDKKQYLKQMGIDVWQERGKAAPVITEIPNNENQWQCLQNKVKNCVACDLHKSRTQTVFGVGSENADVMVVGEAPGYYEDKQGEPFVGRAGQLLNAMLLAIDVKRENIFIANVLKCRPPDNRDPTSEEVAKCTPFLEQQVAHLKPKVIIAVGRVAAHYLLKTKDSMAKLRGKQYTFADTDIPLFVTYHPAYLLRSPQEKRKAYDDLLLIQATLSTIM